jgi:hypothetical protein
MNTCWLTRAAKPEREQAKCSLKIEEILAFVWLAYPESQPCLASANRRTADSR